jgi:hypothetical protein
MKTDRSFTRNRLVPHLRIGGVVTLMSAAAAVAFLAVIAPTTYVSADQLDGTVNGAVSFSNTPLLRDDGDSEPAISIHPNGGGWSSAAAMPMLISAPRVRCTPPR